MSRRMDGMSNTTPNLNPEDPSQSADAGEQALSQYRAHPTTDNLVNCVLAYADAATARIERLTGRLAKAEAEIEVLKAAAAQHPDRPRLRASAAAVPTARQGGV